MFTCWCWIITESIQPMKAFSFSIEQEKSNYTQEWIKQYISLAMTTSSNGSIFRVTCPLCGKFTGHQSIPLQRPVTRSFDVFFDLHLNKRLNKQSWGWCFETPLRSLWWHCNVSWVMIIEDVLQPNRPQVISNNHRTDWHVTKDRWRSARLQYLYC